MFKQVCIWGLKEASHPDPKVGSGTAGQEKTKTTPTRGLTPGREGKVQREGASPLRVPGRCQRFGLESALPRGKSPDLVLPHVTDCPRPAA